MQTNLRRIGGMVGVVAFAAGLSACRLTGFNDTPSKTTASSATAWLLTQQQTDGGFEVADSPGFETPDAILAIVENAQQQYGWDKTQARNAVARACEERAHAASRDRRPRRRIRASTRDVAAKIIVLVAEPLGLSATAFDPDGDDGGQHEPRERARRRRCSRTVPTGRALNATTYARDREATGQRRGAREHGHVHPQRAAGERRVGLRRQSDDHHPRHRHDGGRHRGAGRGGRADHGSRSPCRPRVPREPASPERCVASVRQ